MSKVIAVTVTYGDRFDRLCRETIERALQAGADGIVVVDNGSSSASRDGLAAMARADDRIVLLRNDLNKGSAAAFAAGLQRALGSAPEFIWLLDDDNWVADDVLGTLLDVQREEAERTGDVAVVVAARRIPNAFHARLLEGARVDAVYPPVGAFLGFDLVTYARRKMPLKRPAGDSGRPRIPYAPYGGLLLRSEVVEKVGLPPAELVLYSDDTVWTSQIVMSGYQIVLALGAVIEDAEGKWTQETAQNSVGAAIRSPHKDRLYLSTRNRIWFDADRVQSLRQRLRYQLNRLVVLSVAAVSALRHSSRAGFAVFKDAVRDGERHDLSRPVGLS
ncbi:Glycosyltransferase, GT2 family [Microbacterium azadirachtae]|uniref:Glycosyltransferase, GT2 family n=1 Tax=Microbacterium azadirachtae TaxID=582680 RepID=A0A1I6JGS8_9MICO|nr:glycosyltransferase [Microbacterium azadirachtae]SFR78059.1 Glycosyltransferase, GT2 family [Microbacterium azadirachtae]